MRQRSHSKIAAFPTDTKTVAMSAHKARAIVFDSPRALSVQTQHPLKRAISKSRSASAESARRGCLRCPAVPEDDDGLARLNVMTTSHLLLRALFAFAGLACAPVLTPSAHAAVVDIEWSADQRFVHDVDIAPGKFAEVCGKQAAGSTVSWRFEATAPLDFNIHYHQGRDIVLPEKRDAAAAAEGLLKVRQDQNHCWMWTNKTAAPVGLRLQLQLQLQVQLQVQP